MAEAKVTDTTHLRRMTRILKVIMYPLILKEVTELATDEEVIVALLVMATTPHHSLTVTQGQEELHAGTMGGINKTEAAIVPTVEVQDVVVMAVMVKILKIVNILGTTPMVHLRQDAVEDTIDTDRLSQRSLLIVVYHYRDITQHIVVL